MRWIKMFSFQELSLAIPKAEISEPDDAGVSWIRDHKERSVGHILWKHGQIIFHSDYEHANKIIDKIGREKFTEIDEPC